MPPWRARREPWKNKWFISAKHLNTEIRIESFEGIKNEGYNCRNDHIAPSVWWNGGVMGSAAHRVDRDISESMSIRVI